MEEALQRLRTRLLDLSSRNRLLSYRHPRGRCVQFVDDPDLDVVYRRVRDGKVNLKWVPEPSPVEYQAQRKKPEPRHYAEKIGIKTAYEFAPSNRSDGRQLRGLQTLYYPADFDRLLTKIAREAKTVIEETGTNMLYLMFGFLEFYDSEESEQAMLAPLLSVPVTLKRGGIDPETGTYQYEVEYNDDDVTENYTLREKLKQDFRLNLPETRGRRQAGSVLHQDISSDSN